MFWFFLWVLSPDTWSSISVICFSVHQKQIRMVMLEILGSRRTLLLGLKELMVIVGWWCLACGLFLWISWCLKHLEPWRRLLMVGVVFHGCPVPLGMLVHFFLLKFLFCSLCSLSILRFSYVSARFLNNINKNKKCSIVLNLLNLVKKALSVWEKDNKNANLGKKSTEGNLFIVVCT